jgi:hypothetical protein
MFTDMDSAGQLRWRLSDSPIALLALPTRLGGIQVRPSSQLSHHGAMECWVS